jgi:plasmid stabilization system protein ParE
MDDQETEDAVELALTDTKPLSVTNEDRVQRLWAYIRNTSCHLDAERFTRKLRETIAQIVRHNNQGRLEDPEIRQQLARTRASLSTARTRMATMRKLLSECHRVIGDGGKDRDVVLKKIEEVIRVKK